jgi:hypothetical protein
MNFVATWLGFLTKRPVVFNSLTGSTLCASSDVSAQYYETTISTRTHPSPDDNQEASSIGSTIHVRRVLSAGLIGAFFGGCVYPVAYARLDALFPGKRWTVILQKSIVEIATVGIFVNSVSMMSRGLLIGREPQQVAHHVCQEMPIVTWNDARVWLPYNCIAFSMIPIAIRPTTTLCMEAGWQAYISLMSHNYHGGSLDNHENKDDVETMVGGAIVATTSRR